MNSNTREKNINAKNKIKGSKSGQRNMLQGSGQAKILLFACMYSIIERKKMYVLFACSPTS